MYRIFKPSDEFSEKKDFKSGKPSEILRFKHNLKFISID